MKIIVNPLKVIGTDRLELNPSPNNLRWGKATRKDQDTFEIIQGPVECKDYIVDTQYRKSTGNYQSHHWMVPDIHYPAVWFQWQNVVEWIEHIKDILNPWEIKHGFTPCVVHKCTLNNSNTNVYVLEFDPKWMTNSSIFSFYLSLVRYCYTVPLGQPLSYAPLSKMRAAQAYDLDRYTNEIPYFIGLPSIVKPFLIFLVDNPTYMFDNLMDCRMDGTLVNEMKYACDVHGGTGFYHLSHYMGNDGHDNNLRIQYMWPVALFNKWKQEGDAQKKKEKKQDVEMQSV